jgi:hypothetical protein
MSVLSRLDEHVLDFVAPDLPRSTEAIATLAGVPPEVVPWSLHRLRKRRLIEDDGSWSRWRRTPDGTRVLVEARR